MNVQRRAKVRKALELLDRLEGVVAECAQEERDAFENMPEGVREQQGKEEPAEALEEAVNSLDQVREDLERVVEP